MTPNKATPNKEVSAILDIKSDDNSAKNTAKSDQTASFNPISPKLFAALFEVTTVFKTSVFNGHINTKKYSCRSK